MTASYNHTAWNVTRRPCFIDILRACWYAFPNRHRRYVNVPEQINNAHKGTSRRRFLGVLGIGIAGAALVAGLTPFGRRNQTADAANEFPGPGSMFHPAQDPRTDPRR